MPRFLYGILALLALTAGGSEAKSAEPPEPAILSPEDGAKLGNSVSVENALPWRIAVLFVIFGCFLLWAAQANAQKGPILQLDTGGHMAKINGLAFTPDGKYIVSAGDDKVIRIWDWRAGKTVRTIRGQSGPGPEGKIAAMALSPDGRWLAVAGWTPDNDIRLYDFASGQLKALLKGHRDVVFGLAFSPDGKKLISGSGLAEFSAIIWDVEMQTLLHRLQGHRDHIFAVGFTPDGTRAVTGSFDRTLRLWNAADGALIKEMTGHSDKVRSLAVSPRDGSIASGDWSGEIRLWDGKTGSFKKVLAHQDGEVGSLLFSPDGRLLLSTCGYAACNGPQRIYDAASGRELTAYTKQDSTVLASAFSPAGSLVATGGGDDNKEIHVWDPKTGETKAVLKGTGRSDWAVGFSEDGRSIAWGNTFEYRDNKSRGPLEMAMPLPGGDSAMAEPGPLTSQRGWVRAMASFGGLSLAHRKGGAYGLGAILDLVKDGKPSGISIERGPANGYQHHSYSFTPDGKQIISGGSSGWLSAYGLDGKKLGDFVGHEADVTAVAASPDGRYLVSGSIDQTVRLWNLKTRELLVTIFRGTDGEWVMWIPEGFYAGSPGADKIVGWQINQGPDQAARYVTAGQLRRALHRPDLVAAKIAHDPVGHVQETAARLDIDALIAPALAPEVAILSPEDGAKLAGTNVAITVRITDRGGGIGRIEFKLNGQLVGSAYGALMLSKDGTVTRSFDVATPDTKIEVTAEDRSGTVQSLPAAIAVYADAKAFMGVPDLYVLAIGVNRYSEPRHRLAYAVADAHAIAETLREAGTGFYRNAPRVNLLFDEDVTAEKVGAAFKELGRQVKASDVFVFYIAGVGKTMDGDYYFLPPAMDSFSEDEIKRRGFGPAMLSAWFETIPAQKSIWIFDTCESSSAGSQFRIRGAADDAAYMRLKEATGRTLLMAAGEQQAAIEGYRNHGLFTYAFLEGLAKAGTGDLIFLFDLADYLERRVPELSRELKTCDARGPREYCQKPIARIGGQNFPIVPRFPKVLAMLGANAAQIAAKPTHVVLAATALFETANRGAHVKQQLERGESVTLIKTENGLALIAKDGKPLGYVEEDKLLQLSD